MHTLEMLNHALFLRINAAPGTRAWLIATATIVANDLIYGLPLLLVALWLAGGRERRSAALLAFAVAMLGLGANQLIGMLWPQPRPFAIGLGHAWATHAADPSFPSDHLTVFAGIGLGLLLGGQRLLGAATIAAGLAVGYARVFLGLHFPLDMAGSLGVAGASCAVVFPLWRRAGQRITQQIEGLYRLALARPIAWRLLRS